VTGLDAVMAELERLASPQIATIFLRRQPAARVLGVRYGDMAKVIKRFRRDPALAVPLWETGFFEARHVACAIVDPADVTEARIDAWIEEVDFPLTADDLAGVVARTPFAARKRRQWTARDEEFVRRTGYCLVQLAAKDAADPVSDEELLSHLSTIEREIHGSANWARETMNEVPIAIGHRAEHLHAPALATARAYGAISVFHGDKTQCTITDAVKKLADPPRRPAGKRGMTHAR